MSSETLDQQPVEYDPVHLLLVADSKAGKSVYAGQAVLDGFDMVYFDGDNGISALRYIIGNDIEAQKRVHYFRVNRLSTFLKGFLRSTTARPFRWIKDLNIEWSKVALGVEDDMVVWEFDQSKLPPQWIVDTDSWTSVASDALGIGDASQAAVLLEGVNQGVYGEANANCTYIVNLLQKVPYHVIVQAHGTRYEVYDKPIGVSGVIKQNQMTLREVKDVPVSCSRPHGETMVSRFNHIGWLYVNNFGRTDIDFERRPNRVGGGPPNRKEDVAKLPFSKLVTGGVPARVEAEEGWFVKRTHKELVELMGGPSALMAKPAAPAASATPAAPAKPILPPAGSNLLAGLKK